MKTLNKKLAVFLAAVVLAMNISGCEAFSSSNTETQGISDANGSSDVQTESDGQMISDEEPVSDDESASDGKGTSEAQADAPLTDEPATGTEVKNGDVYILFTSDVHCGVDQGFGYAGLAQIRNNLEAQGYETILVDDGDSVQGELIGMMSQGESIIKLMNALKYDVAIPGNHEFDYGMEQFMELVKMADFPYISCNFTHNGELVLSPYVIKEAAGMKIAFVGVTTPWTITSSSPKFFQNENGEFIYGFMQDYTGASVYEAVQNAVDAAREEGADFVYALGHVGMSADAAPYNYEGIISNTNGIDVFLDGHSHDTEQVVMKNKDGESVVRSGVGTKLQCIGYSHISADKKIEKTDVWSWPNDDGASWLFGIDNEVSREIDALTDELEEIMDEKVASLTFDLVISDPESVDANGHNIRIVRQAETNLGDFCADAYRYVTGADIAIVGGGGVRKNLSKGDITYGDILTVHPFNNQICVIRATGQQILDVLEWGAHSLPSEFGGFMQVSGLSYEVDMSIASGCQTDESDILIGIEGERRVKNVLVGGQPIDKDKTYTVAGSNYSLLDHGDGITCFDGAELLMDNVKLDSQVLIEYITDILGGVIGDEYADPYGQDRIVINQGE